MHHILYRIINNLNNKFYIGIHSTTDLNDGYMGSGVGIIRAIQKYGRENFTKEILSTFPDRDQLLDMEKFLVDRKMLRRDDCYNMILGGQKGVGRGEDHPNYGISFSEEHKRKIGEAQKGKTLRESTKRKVSENHADVSGKNNPMFGVPRPDMEGENNPNYGGLSEEHKENMSKSLKGKFSGSDNPNYNNGEKIEGSKNPNANQYKHKESGRIFGSGTEAANWKDIPYWKFLNQVNHNPEQSEFIKI